MSLSAVLGPPERAACSTLCNSRLAQEQHPSERDARADLQPLRFSRPSSPSFTPISALDFSPPVVAGCAASGSISRSSLARSFCARRAIDPIPDNGSNALERGGGDLLNCKSRPFAAALSGFEFISLTQNFISRGARQLSSASPLSPSPPASSTAGVGGLPSRYSSAERLSSAAGPTRVSSPGGP